MASQLAFTSTQRFWLSIRLIVLGISLVSGPHHLKSCHIHFFVTFTIKLRIYVCLKHTLGAGPLSVLMRSECTNEGVCTLTLHGLILNSTCSPYDAWELSLLYLVVSSQIGIESSALI